MSPRVIRTPRVFRALVAAVVPALAAATASAAAAATPAGPDPGVARLQGQFLLAGRVTVAKNIRGEHTGQKVLRTWTFVPGCPTGACPTVGLVRSRAAGSDQLLLHLRSPGSYAGAGSFFAPLRCGSRTFPRGALVPFTITVRVTGAVVAGGAVVATNVSATYTNRSRINLTPCVAALGHDAAKYQGHLVIPG